MIKVGDKVRIRTDSVYYSEDDPSNPAGIIGQVIDIDKSTVNKLNICFVIWGNGHRNAYRARELDKVIDNFIEDDGEYLDDY